MECAGRRSRDETGRNAAAGGQDGRKRPAETDGGSAMPRIYSQTGGVRNDPMRRRC